MCLIESKSACLETREAESARRNKGRASDSMGKNSRSPFLTLYYRVLRALMNGMRWNGNVEEIRDDM